MTPSGVAELVQGDGAPLLAVCSSGTSLPGRIRLYADFEGALPDLPLSHFDILLTPLSAPKPWVRVKNLPVAISQLDRTIRATPLAATVLATVLRLAEPMSFDDALQVESLAYSTLLGGSEFRDWRGRTRRSASRSPARQPIKFERNDEDTVTISLADPASLNAYSRVMRDHLADALDSCLIDPTRPAVILRAEGRTFCVGGALEEFGTTDDLAMAHAIRMEQSVALRLHRLGKRVTALVQGAAIGSGVEIAAAAHRLEATPDSWFHLPELSMGLIPGAGGIASIPRRIGRHRTCFLVLSGQRIGASTALEWGIVDAVLKT